jgi:DNA-directed RNA polymerase sigma subunit (sigma70/sigma32)
MEYLSDRLKEPDDFYQVFAWDKLSTKSQNTLQRAIERSDVWRTSELEGFSFDLLSKISIEDLNDARFIGPARAEELMLELISLFKNLSIRTRIDFEEGLLSQITSISSPKVLAKLTVEEDMFEYLERIASFAPLTPQERHSLFQEMTPSKNPFVRILSGRRDKDVALGNLVDAYLRLSFALSKRICVDQDIRARTLAGNLGLLAGINTFLDKPNIDFESHVMKHVREYIEELIEKMSLSYPQIVDLMFETSESGVSLGTTPQVTALEVPFNNCATFSELFEELDQQLLKLPRVDRRTLAMLKHRHQAFPEPGRSLDEIGKEWGVTRERVRQIVEPLMAVSIQTQGDVPILSRAVEIFEECEDEDEFRARVSKEQIFSGEDFTWQRLSGVAQILSPEDLAKRVHKKHLAMQEGLGADSQIRGLIKKDRSKFGLYDLKVISRKYKVNDEKAFKLIFDIYPRSIRSGNLVLARTRNLDTMFENSIAKQLKVKSPLDVPILLKGIERTGKNRDVGLIGSTQEITDLILKLAGNLPNYQEISKHLIKDIDFQSLDKWLIEVFSNSSLGILHSNDVVNFALNDGNINVSSVTVYLLNSPIIRSHGKSIYSLVGTDVSENDLDAYTQIIRGTSETSEVAYEMLDAAKGILTVKPNLNVITSGIVFPPSGSKKVFQGFEFKSSCVCGNLETIQAVKFAPSGFWTGFTAMIRHGFSSHGMTKNSILRFEFDFDTSRVKLIP